MWKIIEFVVGLWRKKKKPAPAPAAPRRVVDTNAIRARIAALGWKVLELPIKRNHPDASQRKVIKWKLVASKGERSLEVTGPDIDAAFKNLGTSLGVIAR